ncbi:hypothetical protein N0V84_011943 [Fusarium piperis]|uniref:Formylmethionine deformylase-like protein n=1 Tax=Fusarium piperis TaxID=1435070 RepID=A0A9W8TB67_9HYPO|nr:hypothetical protein N0V84_011943 [Fusarium piperis]
MQRPDGYPSSPPEYPASPPAPRLQDVESWDEIHMPAQKRGGESVPLKPVAVPTVVPIDVNGHGTYNSTQQPLPDFQKRAIWLRFPSSPWIATYSMYFFLVAGVCFAIGHHFFYSSLDGEIVGDQLRMLRWGTALAFASKASLTAAVLSAFDQQVWATVRSRFLTVVALDSMFAATENPLDLLNFELLTKAKMAIAMALFGWCAPAIVIITANTLLVAPPEFMHQNVTCRGVRSLNFDLDAAYTWPDGASQKGSGLNPLSVAIYNDTSRDRTSIGYYDKQDVQAELLADASSVLRRPVTYDNSTLETCARGWNCTVRVEMKGPGYNCTELGSGVGSGARNLSQQSGEISPPSEFDDVLLPIGNASYFGVTMEGEYLRPQTEEFEAGLPVEPTPRNFGSFRTEPVVWIAYVKTANGTKRPLDPKKAIEDEDTLIPTIMACEYYETQYTLDYQYVDGLQSIKVVKSTPISPVINTTLRRGVSDNEIKDGTTATPEENYVPYGNTTRYKKAATYHALGFLFRSLLRGQIIVHPGIGVEGERALFTKVTSHGDYLPAENLQEVVPSLFEDILFSLLSNQQWAMVVWAADPKKQVLFNEDSGEFPCQRSQPVSRYQYRATTLWAVYGVSVLLASLGVAAGAAALRHNGGLRRDSRFSSILAATRGYGLNRVDWGGPLFDRGQVHHNVRGYKMGYGTVKRDEAESLLGNQIPFTFGFENEIEQKGNRHEK